MTVSADTAHLRPVDEQLGNGSDPAASAPGVVDDRLLEATNRSGLPTTWAPLDLGAVITGDQLEQPPFILERSDGPCLMYAGKSHAISAESESGKTLLAERIVAELLERGCEALFIDFEDGPETAVSRLLSMGLEREAIRERFHYVRPDEPLSGAAWRELDPILGRVALAVIDGVTEGLTLHGLDLRDNTDVARWLELLVRPIQRRGAAVLQLDHVTKDREGRGRYAIGAQHKLAGIDVAYSLRVLEPFGRGVSGSVLLSVEKDRPGHLRALAEGKALATMHVESLPGDKLAISLDPPPAGGDAFRPTVLMERVSRALEAQPGLSKHTIETSVVGKAKVIRMAIELLIAEGFVRVERDGQAQRHYIERPFTHEDEDGDE